MSSRTSSPSSASPRARVPAPSSSTPVYIGWIADVEKSRQFGGKDRAELQLAIESTLSRWNKEYKWHLLARFVITIGDEFQGLLRTVDIVPTLIRRLEVDLPQVHFRIGIARGIVETELKAEAIGMDGMVWHSARAALERAKQKNLRGGVFDGFGDWNSVVNALARLLDASYRRMTKKQRQIADLYKQGKTQSEVAEEIGINQSLVSRALAAVSWPAIEEAEGALVEALRQLP